MLAALAFGGVSYAGWVSGEGGSYDYFDTANWTGGIVDDVFPPELALSGNVTASLASDYTAANGFDFSHSGAYTLYLRGNGTTTPVLLTLHGGIYKADEKSNVEIGYSNWDNQGKVDVDMGGSPREFYVGSQSKLIFWNNLHGVGGIVKEGAGDLILRGRESDFKGDITVNGGTLTIGDQGAISDACLGDPANDVYMNNGATLKIGHTADKAHVAFSPTRDFFFPQGGSISKDYGTSRVHIPGNIVAGEKLSSTDNNIIFSGKNVFAGGLNIGANAAFSSYDNIGGTSTPFDRSRYGTAKITIMGTGVTNLSGNVFTQIGGDGTSFCIQNPDNVFYWDQDYSHDMNSGNAPNLCKEGAGTFVVVTNQTFYNKTGSALELHGGVFKLDAARGGVWVPRYGNNRTMFFGGTLEFAGDPAAGSSMSLDATVIGEGGGTLVVNNNGGAGETAVHLGDMMEKSGFTRFSLPCAGSSFNIYTVNEGAGAARVAATGYNDESGAFFSGRVVFNGSDWAFIDSEGNISAYSGYVPGLPALGASGTANYVVSQSSAVSESESVNTLKIDTGKAGGDCSLTISDGKTLTIGRGLLLTGPDGVRISGGALRPGVKRLTVSDGQDFVIQNFCESPVVISSVITNAAPSSVYGTFSSLDNAAYFDEETAGYLYAGMSVLLPDGTATSIKSVGADGKVVFNASVTFDGSAEMPVSSINSLTVSGPGYTVLEGTNFYSNETFILGGTVEIPYQEALGSDKSKTLYLVGGRLRVTGDASMSRVVDLSGNGGTFDVADGKTLTLSGRVDGGNLVLDNSDGGAGVLSLKGDNSSRDYYLSGEVVVKQGVLVLGHDNALSKEGFNWLRFGNGSVMTVRLNGPRTITVAGLSSDSPAAVVENGSSGEAVLRVYNGADNTFAGTLRDGEGDGTLSLVKGGCGRMVLSADHTNTGVVHVQGGTLEVNGSFPGDGAVVVSGGALSGSGSVGNVTVTGGGALAVEERGQCLNVGTLVMEDGAAFEVSAGRRTVGPAFHVSGDMDIRGVVNVRAGEGFGPGAYILAECDGAARNSGIEVGEVPEDKLTYSVHVGGRNVVLNIGMPASFIILK